MIVSDDCVALVKEFEGLRLESYPDPATGGAPITCCYGHTGPEVKLGMRFTQDQCLAYLFKDLTYFSERVRAMLSFEPSQGELDAMTSFAYNCGLGNLQKSTLLRKANAGDIEGAANEFLRWDKAAGKVMPGLTRRRIAERELFLK